MQGLSFGVQEDRPIHLGTAPTLEHEEEAFQCVEDLELPPYRGVHDYQPLRTSKYSSEQARLDSIKPILRCDS